MALTEFIMPEPEREVSGGYVGDLLSWVMGRAQTGNVWLTIMSNQNVAAVALMAEVSCVVLTEGVKPDEALRHIARYGSGHSESIITADGAAAREFQARVDAACVYVNAPTSFTDGAQFGLGAEIGISTQKLGPRGPMGLQEICTYKWLIDGEGQTRP